MHRIDRAVPPGSALRDPSYHDICGFFGTFEEGKNWQPAAGDWVAKAPETEPFLVTGYDVGAEVVTLIRSGSVVLEQQPRAHCVWLPSLDQLHRLLKEQFGTVGFFSSAFKESTYWYTGQMLGMTVTNMQPLAEGKSPEEAAVKALLMRHSW